MHWGIVFKLYPNIWFSLKAIGGGDDFGQVAVIAIVEIGIKVSYVESSIMSSSKT